jgi:hypothetical protein
MSVHESISDIYVFMLLSQQIYILFYIGKMLS